jgi:hypothetical protein
MRSPATRIACLALTLTAAASAAVAQTPTSGQLAKQLVTSLTGSGLAAIAARDPSAPDRAVAAPYPDAAGLDALLAHRMYRDVYTTLQQPSFNQGKVFIQDLGCDGLQSGPESVDVMYEDGKTQTIFDGNWKKQKLSESEYQQRVKKAEERYVRLLSVLIEQARSGTK